MSRWDFECVFRDVRDRLRPDYDSLYKAMEYVAENWVDVEKAKKSLEGARAELDTAKSELASAEEEIKELKRERPVEVPDEDEHVCPRCDKQGARTADECSCCTPASVRQDTGGCYTCGYEPCLCDQQ